jgi:hypothetical protein
LGEEESKNIEAQILKLENNVKLTGADTNDGIKLNSAIKAQKIVNEIGQGWLASDNHRMQAFIAFSLKKDFYELNYLVIFELPTELLINWNGFKSILLTELLQVIIKFKDVKNRNSLTSRLISFLFGRAKDSYDRGHLTQLSYIFIEDPSKNLRDKFRVICDVIYWTDGKYIRSATEMKEAIINQARQELKLQDVPNSWVEEILKTSYSLSSK